eukprot:CAMPEP_0196252544 /NCGR_PEP_ID=MMETSP0913-20130531/49797_1 /TAXON_ID=49265 /ORGANISM="Thalassiosira rotula, Strain GSO102" /LENGTH=58 /DNA_ID=CAMNT_0041539177 /DNA_START=40 /DNA_END=212 /DNA_ORIENTATION=+
MAAGFPLELSDAFFNSGPLQIQAHALNDASTPDNWEGIESCAKLSCTPPLPNGKKMNS